MKAKIWMDRETGYWCFYAPGAIPPSGDRPTWEEALAEVLDELDARRAVRM